MSQVLFQELVPLQVKCKDCEERCVPRYPVPAGGGWGPAKAGGREGGRKMAALASGHLLAAGCATGVPGRGESLTWNQILPLSPSWRLRREQKGEYEEMGS